jgi:uncharacterized protein (UPF0335 family)
MEIDFDKQCNNIIENCEQIENEMENLETDCKKLHQRIEEYRYFNMKSIVYVKIKIYIILI